MKITDHFDSSEFACRDGTPYPEKWVSSRLKPLCEQLEIIRAAIGEPIKIISGFRTKEYNRKIKGARKSQHVFGLASDIKTTEISAVELHKLILKMFNDKVIKLGGLGEYPNFVHLDIRRNNKLVRWRGSRVDS